MTPCLSKGMSEARLASFLSLIFITLTPSLTQSSPSGTVLRGQCWEMGDIPGPSPHGQLEDWLPCVSSGPFSSAPVQRFRNYLSWGLTPEQSCNVGLEREAWGRSCQKLWLRANQLAAEPKAPVSPQTPFVSLGLPFSAASPQVIIVGTLQFPSSFYFCVSDHFTHVN